MFFSYHEVIAMKVSKSSLTVQSTKFYTNLTTYQQADENEPYITAVFNNSYIKEYHAIFELGMSLRSITHESFFNLCVTYRSYLEKLFNDR